MLRVLALTAVVLLLGTGVAAAQALAVTVDPAMTKGPASAPVTIVEFSDYQ